MGQSRNTIGSGGKGAPRGKGRGRENPGGLGQFWGVLLAPGYLEGGITSD